MTRAGWARQASRLRLLNRMKKPQWKSWSTVSIETVGGGCFSWSGGGIAVCPGWWAGAELQDRVVSEAFDHLVQLEFRRPAFGDAFRAAEYSPTDVAAFTAAVRAKIKELDQAVNEPRLASK